MTPFEWKNLQLGDTLHYSTGESYRHYEDTYCEVIGFDSHGNPKIAIVTPGINGFTTWDNGRPSTDSFRVSDAFKFQIISSKNNSLEHRIANKIKTLDAKWALKQKEKGNEYAMFLL